MVYSQQTLIVHVITDKHISLNEESRVRNSAR